jgi:hypothetical protein
MAENIIKDFKEDVIMNEDQESNNFDIILKNKPRKEN